MKLVKGWPILLLLYYAKEVVTHIKLQKLLFLSEAEGRLKLDYKFERNDFGPYDETVKIDFMYLESINMIEIIERKRRSKSSYRIFKVTEEGEKYVKSEILKQVDKKTILKFQKIVRKYGNQEWKEIVRMVYEKYDISEEKLGSIKNKIITDLQNIRTIWMKVYTADICEPLFILLATIDYSLALLSREQIKTDKTQFNVIVASVNDIDSYLKRLTSVLECHKEECPIFKCKKDFSDMIELFLYIQYMSEKYNIMPSLSNKEAYIEDFLKEPIEGDDLRQVQMQIPATT